MGIPTLSSRELSQHAGRAMRATKTGPVFITDRGRLAYVLLSIEDYRKLSGTHKNILDLLAMPGAAEIDFEPPRLRF